MNAIALLETGEYSDVNLYFDNEVYRLHKFPLLLKMGYVKEKFLTSSDVHLPFIEGGSKVFFDIVAFCYGKEIEIHPRNVTFLSNAARVLDMYGKRNLIELTDEYVNILVTDMRVSHKFGPAMVALAYASTLKNHEYCETFVRLFDTTLSMWVRRSQHSDERLTVDPIMTEFLVFLPEPVITRVIQEVSSMKSTYYAIAELVSKYFALRFAIDALCTGTLINQVQSPGDESEASDCKNGPASAFLKRAVQTTCIPFERLSGVERDLMTEELDGINFDTTHLDETMENFFSILPLDVSLASRVNVEWCKQALAVTERRRDSSISRSIILEITGKMLARFSVQELRMIPPQTIKDILATMHSRAKRPSDGSGDVTMEDGGLAGADDSKGGPNKGLLRCAEPSSIAENLDLYFNAAIESQNMSIEEYVGLLKTAMPFDRRENHDGLIRGICKLVMMSKDALTDNLREEILSVLDLQRCSAAALQEALNANILPTRAVAEAALRFAKQNLNMPPVNNTPAPPRERSLSPTSSSRYSLSTSSLYRTSRYAMPLQYYGSPSYFPTSLLNSSVRHYRRPWERSAYGLDEPPAPAVYRHYDTGAGSADFGHGKADNEGEATPNFATPTSQPYRSSEY